jgi:hypothetical protein
VSPPEYFRIHGINQSFSAVGAFTTGEVNLTAGDRPLRCGQAGVDDGLLTALGVQPIQGRLFRKGEADHGSAACAGVRRCGCRPS